MPESDEALMARVSAGDQEAFAELVRRYEAKARRYAWRFFRDTGVAEDIAQEVFLRIHRSSARYRPSGRFQTYLYRIAANLCYDRLRMLKRRGSSIQNTVDNYTLDHVEDAPSTRFDPPDRGVELGEEKAMVREAIGRLPPGLAQILVLREFEGLKYREIGDVLSIPVNEVKVKLHGARKRLQRELRAILL
jgi:RNA polymerase sigma-70 factor (ECF subfamily)